MNIKISAEISLSEISLKDRKILYELMSKIYPAAYAHLWKDQGKGIGKKIIHWMESELQETKTSYLWLEVMDTQENAIQFYEKLGFRIVDSIKFKSDLMKEEFKGMYLMKKDIKKSI